MSAIRDHAHLAWDNKLPCSAESPSQAGAKKVPLTSSKITPEVGIVNPYNFGAQQPAEKRVDAVSCTTRGAGRRGLEKRTNNHASSPPRGKELASSFDSYIATAGKDLLYTAKDALEKANDQFTKTGTAALAKTMKTGFISEFKKCKYFRSNMLPPGPSKFIIFITPYICSRWTCRYAYRNTLGEHLCHRHEYNTFLRVPPDCLQTVKSQTKSLSDALTRAVTNATPTGGAPLKGRRAKGRTKVTEAGPADETQWADEADTGNVLTAEFSEHFTGHT